MPLGEKTLDHADYLPLVGLTTVMACRTLPKPSANIATTFYSTNYGIFCYLESRDSFGANFYFPAMNIVKAMLVE
jgi:hypothetical protein